MKKNKRFWQGWQKFYKIMLILMPAVLYFSYYPLIKFGSDGVMNFELSIPLLWLAVFGVVTLGLIIKKGDWLWLRRKWWILLFPVFATLSILWSGNMLRGFLTVGVLWLLVLAVVGFILLGDEIKNDWVRKWFWRVFYVSGLAVCGWCLVQCILDLMGVSRDVSLMCAGCTYTMFGFPHPNGFAIEPQFMGNLLIAPAFLAGVSFVYAIKDRQLKSGIFNTVLVAFGDKKRSKKWIIWCSGLLFLLFMVGLFLTFSRGAIYALGVAMMIFTIWEIWKSKKVRVLILWPIMLLAFLLTLNLQGIFAQVSRTDDTYFDGVAKVVNHLSLGVIDIRAGEKGVNGEFEEVGEIGEAVESVTDEVVNIEAEQREQAVFDGYVEESTTARVWLAETAIKIWRKDWRTVIFGVGIGGAGMALYQNGMIYSPKEIVQNEYVSLLLETGLIGVMLLILTLVLTIMMMRKRQGAGVLVALAVGYGVSLCFFSGLPNALHIYLLLGVLASARLYGEL